MVRVTSVLLKYVPEWYHMQKSSSSFFKKQSLFYMTRFYKNLGYSSHKNAMNRYQYFLNGEMYFAARNSKLRLDANRSRIAAACEEHNMKYDRFISTLRKIDIHLDLSSLARLAIYEPRTFQSLVEICQDVTNNQLQPANFNPKLV